MSEFLYTEIYRPETIEDCILPDDIKTYFLQLITQGSAMNLLLVGPPGCGKTTAAKAMLNQIGADYIVINGSKDGTIDTLRTEIQNYASSISFMGGRKYVIIDEADGLSPAIQKGLRAFIEEYSSNCGFIFTCNYRNKIIGAIADSRCTVINFNFSRKDLPPLAQQFLKRCIYILESEKIPFDRKVLAKVVAKFCPDWRRTINEIQRYSIQYNAIDERILVAPDTSIGQLIKAIKEKDFIVARQWIGENPDVSTDELFKKIYDTCNSIVEKESIPDLILLMAKYQYQAALVANPEINLAAAILEIMMSCQFK